MKNMQLPAEKCQTMADVRVAIDALDQEIVGLLAERIRYIDAAARIKAEREAVRDEDRKAEVLANVDRTARELNMPADLAAALYELMVEYSISYEMTVFDAKVTVTK